MKKVSKSFFFTLILSLGLVAAYAQPTDPGVEPDVPVDGGITLLLAAGAGYGIKKIRDKMTQNEE